MLRFALLLLACCGTASAPPPTRTGPPAAMEPAAAGDVVVATVNGRAVYGACVAGQAARKLSRQEALRQCIDFELLAQAADARGLALDPDVGLATRTALVSTLVAREYEDKHTRPEDFGPLWERHVQRNQVRIAHPDARASTYVRVEVATGAPPEADTRAHALADDIAAAAAREPGLLGPSFVELAQRVVGTRATLAHEDVDPYYANGRLEKPYITALFAIPEVGGVSPAVRTKRGWDVIAWTADYPAIALAPDAVARELVPEVKRAYFSTWVSQIATSLGVHVDVLQQNFAVLESL